MVYMAIYSRSGLAWSMPSSTMCIWTKLGVTFANFSNTTSCYISWIQKICAYKTFNFLNWKCCSKFLDYTWQSLKPCFTTTYSSVHPPNPVLLTVIIGYQFERQMLKQPMLDLSAFLYRIHYRNIWDTLVVLTMLSCTHL